MGRFEVTRGDLARALAERSRATGGELPATQLTPRQLTLAQAQDEVDRVVHRIVTRLRQGQRAEMPGVGPMTAQIPPDVRRVDAKRVPAAKPGPRKKTAAPARKSKS